MTSHTLQSLLDVKVKLEKLIHVENIKENEENVVDCLNVLESFPVTSDLITQSALGNTIIAIKDKFHHISSEVVEKKAQSILVHWKSIKKTKATSSSSSGTQKSMKEHIKSDSGDTNTKTISSSSHHHPLREGEASSSNKKKLLLQESAKVSLKIEDKENTKEQAATNDKRKSLLSQTRKGVVKIFTNCFSGIVLSPKAERIGLDIEEEINNLYNSEIAHKDYLNKAKGLLVSIKMNKVSSVRFSVHLLTLCL
jgi:hypothetical protein